MNLSEMLKSDKVLIFAGEGVVARPPVVYEGKRTARAIKRRLTQERCNGDRWAKAAVYSHTNDYGDVYVTFFSNETFVYTEIK